MATKIGSRRRPGAAESGESAAADELDVLHPERILVLSGRRIVVREYGHVEWLRLLPAAKPLVDAIAAHLRAGHEPSYEEALEVMAAHIDGLMPLVLQACDIDIDVFERLAPDEGELLLMTWWGVNGRFFVQRALNKVAVRLHEARARSATARSTPPSSHMDTPAASSTATQNDS